MVNSRLLPYVDDRTLDLVLDRLRNKETDYLKHITQKISSDNPVLCFSRLRDFYGNLPLPFGVYELLHLSLPKGGRLPRVEPDTIGGILEEPIIIATNLRDLLIKVDFSEVQEDGNENLFRFIDWLDHKKRCIINRPLVKVIYSSLREQARRDRILSN